jgi:hypothetical protein
MVVVAVVVVAVVVTTMVAVAALMVASPAAMMHAVVVITPVVVVVLRENADPAGQDEHEREKRAEFLHLSMLLPSGCRGDVCSYFVGACNVAPGPAIHKPNPPPNLTAAAVFTPAL